MDFRGRDPSVLSGFVPAHTELRREPRPEGKHDQVPGSRFLACVS